MTLWEMYREVHPEKVQWMLDWIAVMRVLYEVGDGYGS